MKKYTLKTKMGEKIAYTNAEDLFEAQEKFSRIKVLPITELLLIFIVELVG
jgi:hypothetical protein